MVANNASHCPMLRQRGGALLVMLVILVMGITTVFVTSLSGPAISNKRNQTTADALARAKEALIGYAISYGDTHPEDPLQPRDTAGYLPCPDTNGSAGANPEGSSETCGSKGANSMGRLPWKTLELPSIFDGQQNCLWYAVSGNYKNNPKYGGPMNWDTPAQLHVFDSNGNELEAGEVVAVIFSPGAPLSGNSDRSGTTAPICGGNYSASAYLDNDTIHGINNSDVATGKFILPHEHRDASGNVTLSVNDQFVFITRQDIWSAIEKRIARETKQCLDTYAASLGAGGKYPLAISVAMPAMPALFGRLGASPNRTTPTTDDLLMVRRFEDLITKLLTFQNDPTTENFNAIHESASDAKSAAKDVEKNYDGVNSTLKNAAEDLKNAADTAKDWNSWPSASSINNVLNDIYDASAIFSSNLPVDTSMPASWPASCTLFSSERWTGHWQNLIFYQLADGYRPGSAAVCGTAPNTCLSIEGRGHSASGSGSYRAAIIASGKMLTASRNSSVPGDYLEADNLLPSNNVSNPYKTYRTTDAAHQTVNDLVLCLDGEVNCK